MQELDTWDGGRPLTGRHRATPSVTRRAAVRVAVAAVGLLVVLVGGRLATEGLGLTGTSDVPLGGASAPSLPGHLQADPTFGRTIDITGTSTPPTQEPTAAAVADHPGAELRPASSIIPEPQAALEPPPEPAPAPIPAVRPGDPCPAEGDTGVTRTGETTVCTATPGDGGHTRWRPT